MVALVMTMVLGSNKNLSAAYLAVQGQKHVHYKEHTALCDATTALVTWDTQRVDTGASVRRKTSSFSRGELIDVSVVRSSNSPRTGSATVPDYALVLLTSWDVDTY